MSQVMIKKPRTDMIIPDMIQNIAPVYIPQMQFKQSLITGLRHNWKLGQMAKEAKFQADISVDKNRTLTAYLDSMRQLQTYVAVLDSIFKQFAHDERMRQKAEQKADEENTKLNLQNQLLFMEVEKVKFENRQMYKEAGNKEPIEL